MPDDVLARLNAFVRRALAENGRAFSSLSEPEQEFNGEFFSRALHEYVGNNPDPCVAVVYKDATLLVPLPVLSPWLYSDQVPASMDLGVRGPGPGVTLPAGAHAMLILGFSKGARIDIYVDD